MRVYHFVNRKFGLEDLHERRIKIAELLELNDPFEFFAHHLPNQVARKVFRIKKAELSKTKGLLCFSRRWTNPVQWSHYAEKHQGLCLGFDVADSKVRPIEYVPSRVTFEIEKFTVPSNIDESLLFTKFDHWFYENEVRAVVPLGKREGGLCYQYFGDLLELREVIIGAESKITRADIKAALGDLEPTVSSWKARLAFGWFEVTRQHNQRLWT